MDSYNSTQQENSFLNSLLTGEHSHLKSDAVNLVLAGPSMVRCYTPPLEGQEKP